MSTSNVGINVHATTPPPVFSSPDAPRPGETSAPPRRRALTVSGTIMEPVTWVSSDASSQETARLRFMAWKAKGYAAFDITEQPGTLLHDFDPEAEIIMFPPIQGG